AGSTPYTAVEPHPVSLAVLRENIALNGLDSVRVLAAAVVGRNSADTMTLLVPELDPDQAPAGAYLGDGAEGADRTSRASHIVDVVAASTLVGDADLIKLDVEGYEYEILSSITAYVEANRPTIFVEVLNHTPNLRALLRSWCERLDYIAYVPKANSLDSIPSQDLIATDLERIHGTRDLIMSVRTDLFD
ncbi:MAG: FkbM family methyltransferase, partial [Candidatus Tectomicrobia bacterium]|nr:FkbM family methyltransferase [Candidatus Tectomicrobia bacterium]